MLTSRAARLVQAPRIRSFHSSPSNDMKGLIHRFIYRENRVPYYQRLYQKDDGKRIWWKSPRSAYILYPYYCLVFFAVVPPLWATCRMVMGHRTWY